jgi:hypothetical protein
VIGDRQGRHPVLLGLGHQLLQGAGSIQKAVLAMHMQVDKIGMMHGTSGESGSRV